MFVPNNASNPIHSGSFSLKNLYGRVIFDVSNFNEWIRNKIMAIHYKDREYVLDKELKEIAVTTATPKKIVEHTTHETDATKVSCLMITTITVELQNSYED